MRPLLPIPIDRTALIVLASAVLHGLALWGLILRDPAAPHDPAAGPPALVVTLVTDAMEQGQQPAGQQPAGQQPAGQQPAEQQPAEQADLQSDDAAAPQPAESVEAPLPVPAPTPPAQKLPTPKPPALKPPASKSLAQKSAGPETTGHKTASQQPAAEAVPGLAPESAGTGAPPSAPDSAFQSVETEAAIPALRPISSPPPVYPLSARRSGAQGVAMVTARIGPDGAVEQVRLATSSGHDTLDRAALTAVTRWRFTPPSTTPTELTIPIHFRLEG